MFGGFGQFGIAVEKPHGGRGATRAATEADATAAIARFLNSEVTSCVAVLEQAWEQNGEGGARIEIEAEIFVQAEMQLFGVRHVQDAFFDRASREWITVAFIDRTEAWQVYGPRFRQQSQTWQGGARTEKLAAQVEVFQRIQIQSKTFSKALQEKLEALEWRFE